MALGESLKKLVNLALTWSSRFRDGGQNSEWQHLEVITTPVLVDLEGCCINSEQLTFMYRCALIYRLRLIYRLTLICRCTLLCWLVDSEDRNDVYDDHDYLDDNNNDLFNVVIGAM